MINFVVGQKSLCLLTGLLKYLLRNMAILVEKFGGGKKLSKPVSGYWKTYFKKKKSSGGH